jgi:AcrR family transcriptional regulator
MPRPSRNIDQLLIHAALGLMPATGVRAFSIRQVCERAGVNLGMFHYHFKTKDVFVRAVLQHTYDGMFAALELESHRATPVTEKLGAALNVLGRFGRDHRLLLLRLFGDALSGEAVAAEFLRHNLPRHIAVVAGLIMQGQKQGLLRPVALPQAIVFLAGSIVAPILMGTAVKSAGLAPPVLALEENIFSDAAIAERVDMALAGLVAPARARPPGSKK